MARHSSSSPIPTALSDTDRAVLGVLVNHAGKVAGRETILRMAGLDHLGSRSVDTSIMAIRRALGGDAVTTIRRRGWMLLPDYRESARKLMPQ